MNEELINTAQTLTEQQKIIAGSQLRAGASPRDALQIAQRSVSTDPRDRINLNNDGIILGEGGLLQDFGSAIGRVAEIPGGIAAGATSGRDLAASQGGGFVSQVAGAVTGGAVGAIAPVGRAAGDIVGGAIETAGDIVDIPLGAAGISVSESTANAVQDFTESETGQGIITTANEIDEATFGLASEVLDATGVLGIGAIAKGGAVAGLKSTIGTGASKVKNYKYRSVSEALGKTKNIIRKPFTAADNLVEKAASTVVSKKSVGDLLNRAVKPSAGGIKKNRTPITDFDKIADIVIAKGYQPTDIASLSQAVKDSAKSVWNDVKEVLERGGDKTYIKTQPILDIIDEAISDKTIKVSSPTDITSLERLRKSFVERVWWWNRYWHSTTTTTKTKR